MLRTTSLPKEYSVRPPGWDDVPAVTELVRACDIAQYGVPDTTAEDIRDDWLIPGFDIARDAWLAFARDGALVGYGSVWDKNPGVSLGGDVIVHPSRAGGELDRALLSLVEARARERVRDLGSESRIPLGVMAASVDEAKRRLLETAGFPPVRSFFRMSIDLSGGHQTAEDLPGISVRSFRLGVDDRATHATIEDTFSEHFGFSPRPFDLWWAQLTKHERFDPDLWLLAWDGDRVVGALLAYPFADLGFVRAIGVLKTHRGRGIGTALLLRVFDEFRRRGQNRIALGVDSENGTGAIQLYERIGMRIDQRHELYEKEIRP